jgi:predicted dehydrogenase
VSPATGAPVRVGLVGARRVRQGLGPFVARDLRAAGAEVPCFLVSHEASLEPARAQLAEVAGIDARGYVSLDAMLAERLDALAICSPHETHLHYLEAALSARLHALCEKPLVWGVDDLAGTGARLVRGFAERGLLLRENCPWHHVLPAFERLYPGALARPPLRFAMRLQPAGRGLRMLADALPHPLSLLQALAPGASPRAREVCFSDPSPDAETLELRFRYSAGDASLAVRIELERSDAHPRHVWFELDGRRADRVVAPPDYRLSLRGEGRSVALDDPLGRLVAEFVRELRTPPGARRAPATDVAERMSLLAQLLDAWREAHA